MDAFLFAIICGGVFMLLLELVKHASPNQKAKPKPVSVQAKLPSYVAIDLETATASPRSICQVAIVVVEKGKIVQAKSWLINPKTDHFDSGNIRVHGITPDKVKGSPEFNAVWPEIESYIRLYGAVAAHYAHFDIVSLLATLGYYGITPPRFEVFDSCITARRTWPTLPNHKLPTLAAHIGIKLNHHDALSDANAAANILSYAYSVSPAALVPLSLETVCDKQLYNKVFFGK